MKKLVQLVLKSTAIFLFAVLAFAPSARAAITVQAYGNTGWTTGANLSLTTFTFAPTPGDHGMLIVMVDGEQGISVDVASITWNGTPLTQAASAVLLNGADGAYAHIYYLAQPAVGSGTLSVTLTDSPTRSCVAALYATGVGALEDLTTATSGNSGNLIAGPITASYGALVIDTAGHSAGAFTGGGIVGGGDTLLYNITGSGSGGAASYSIDYRGGGSYSAQWFNSSQNEAVAIASFASFAPPRPMRAPVDLTAMFGDTKVDLAWSPYPGATSYNVKRSETSGSGYATIGTTTDATFADSGLVNFQTYYYVVSAVTNSVETGNSVQVSATPLPHITVPLMANSYNLDGVYALSGDTFLGTLVWDWGLYETGGDRQGTGMPTDGIVSGSGGGSFQMASYTAKNMLKLDNSSGTMTFLQGGQFAKVSFLTIASSSPMVTFTLQFSDGSRATNSFQAGEWAGGGTNRLLAAGSLNYDLATYMLGNWGTLNQADYLLDPGDQTKTLQSVSFSSSGLVGVFAISGRGKLIPVSGPPSVPTIFSVLTGNKNVALTWTVSSGALGYNVWSSNSVSGAVQIDTSAVENYTKTGLDNGTLYYFKIAATNSVGVGAYSVVTNATPNPKIPPAPTLLKVTPDNAKVTLTWTACLDASGYNVKRSTTRGTETNIGTTAGTNYVDLAVVNGMTYYYVVSATNSAGESANSTELSAMPFHNLILNGEFEEGPTLAFAGVGINLSGAGTDLTNWTLIGAGGDEIYANQGWGPVGNKNGSDGSPTGNYLLFLHGASFSQTIPGVAAGDYELTFDTYMRQAPGKNQYVSWEVNGPDGYYLSGDTQTSGVPADGAWHGQASMVTLTTSGDVTVTFTGNGGDSACVDQVALVPWAPHNLILNGEFEEGPTLAPGGGINLSGAGTDITKWTLSGAGGNQIYANQGWGPIGNKNGSDGLNTGDYLLFFNGAGFSQTIPGVAAGNYPFSFDVYMRDNTGSYMSWVVSGSGGLNETGDTQGVSADGTWHAQTFSVALPSSGDVTIAFTSHGGNGACIDQVVFGWGAPVLPPVPTITGITASPGTGGFTIHGSADIAGNLVTEKTTSLATPVTWVPIQTNAVPGGAFSFTIPQGTDPQGFFRLMGQ